MDDFPNDESTTGRFVIGEPVSGILNSDLGFLDSDWFRFSMVEGRSYNFTARVSFLGVSVDVAIEGLNDDGFIEDRTSRGFFDDDTGSSGQFEFLLFTADRTGDFFVSVSDLVDDGDHDFTISATEYEPPDFFFTRLGLDDGVPKRQVIDHFDNFTDRDSFLVELSRNGTYDFTLKGVDSGSGTLEDPVLRIYTGNDGLLVTQDGGGQGRDAALRFVAPETGTYQISAASADPNGTGTYEIGFSLAAGVDDAATGLGTNSQLALAPNQTRVLEGSLEVQGDIDWHKVELFANRWYTFSYTSEDENSVMFVRAPDGSILERAGGESGVFTVRPEQTGTHHLVFRNGLAGYTITGQDNAPPEIAASHGHFRLLGDATINLATLFDIQEYPAERVQVVAEADFFLDGTKFDRFVPHNIDLSDMQRVLFQGDAQRGEYDVSLRAIGAGSVSGWASTVIRSQENKIPLLETGSFWNSSNTQRESDNVITFRFADSLPSYFAEGRFTGFAEANAAVKIAIGRMFGTPDNTTWGSNIDDFVDLQFVQDDSEDADIQIFTADSEQYAIGYKPGLNGFGDVVLDNDFYSTAANDTQVLDDRETFELQRSILTALGARHFVSDVNRNESLVGTTFGTDADIFPQSYGYWDVQFLQHTYGEGNPPDQNESTQALGASDGDFVRTINSNGRPIFALQASKAAVIDLRPGSTSRLTDESAGKQSYVIGEGVFIYRGIGSSSNDQIFGHHSDNRLVGRQGDDVLHGLGGDDILIGSSGNDTYVYETGDGNDVIDEGGDSGDFGNVNGNDTLLIRGKFGVDQIAEDLTFQRLGNDLVINLSTNGNFNLNEGSITIRDMDNPLHMVERLDLRNFTGEVGVYSLPAIFNAATADQQRFAATAQSDAYGLIAVPV